MKIKSIPRAGALLAVICFAANVRGENQNSPAAEASTRAMLYAQADAQLVPPAPPLAPPPPINPVSLPNLNSQIKEIIEKSQAAAADALKRAQDEFAFTGLPFPAAVNSSKHALVIRTSEMDAKSMATAEEDLNVMGRILEKAIYQTGQDENSPSAMGIRLANLPGQGGAKYLQLEGYGAVFMLNVNFPLAGPPNKADEANTSEPTNSTWEEAKREVYGQPQRSIRPQSAKVDYDPQRVEKLKDALLGALKNASNLRALKPEESVTVVVTSGGNGGTASSAVLSIAPVPPRRLTPEFEPGSGRSAGSSGDTAGGVISRDPNTMKKQYTASGGSGGGSASRVVEAKFTGNTDGSTLTIRAKKADIDAFAKGKLSAAEFRNKCSLLIY